MNTENLFLPLVNLTPAEREKLRENAILISKKMVEEATDRIDKEIFEALNKLEKSKNET